MHKSKLGKAENCENVMFIKSKIIGKWHFYLIFCNDILSLSKVNFTI